jgi:hypothetical protein
MGIKDLLQSVGDAMDDNFALCKLAGKRVAIDASSWLHKAIFATAAECLDLNFEEHLLYVDFIVTRTRNFRLCGVEPVLVFDGKRHHMKVPFCTLTHSSVSYISCVYGSYTCAVRYEPETLRGEAIESGAGASTNGQHEEDH